MTHTTRLQLLAVLVLGAALGYVAAGDHHVTCP